MLVYLEYMTPELKKWKLYPIGLAFMMLFGIFLKDAFGFTKAMQIGEPLLKSLPVLTSWYILLVIDMVLFFSFLFSYEKLHNHKSFKESLKDLK